MNRRKLGRAGLAALAATTVLTVAPRAAGAYTSNCKISELPAAQASQSALNYTCLFTNAAGAANELSTSQTFHDFKNVSWHKGAARLVTRTTAAAIGGNTIIATAGNFTANDVNRPVSGVGIAPRTFIKSITSATTAVINQAHTAAAGIGTVVTIENTFTRSVNDAATGSATTSLTSVKANFNASDAGKVVSGTNIKPGTTIASVTNATTAVLSQATITCGAAPLYACSPQTVTIATTAPISTARNIKGTTTSASVITSSTAGFTASDIGLAVTGVGVAAGARITAVTATTATVAPASNTVNATVRDMIVGKPSATAPANNSNVMDLNVALALSPTLSAGAQSCAANVPTGFALQGQLYNPGSFVTGGLIQPVPTGKVVGQIVFTTLLQFAAFVVEVPTDVHVAAPHYDIVWPSLPTALAKCPAPSTVPVLSSFTVNSTVASQNALTTGVGVPGTAQVRYINPATTTPTGGGALPATTGVVAKLVDGTAASATHTVWGPFTKTCNIPAGNTNPALPGVVGSCQTP